MFYKKEITVSQHFNNDEQNTVQRRWAACRQEPRKKWKALQTPTECQYSPPPVIATPKPPGLSSQHSRHVSAIRCIQVHKHSLSSYYVHSEAGCYPYLLPLPYLPNTIKHQEVQPLCLWNPTLALTPYCHHLRPAHFHSTTWTPTVS